MTQLWFYAFLLSPLLLFRGVERLALSPLWGSVMYVGLWAAWELYLRTQHPELWLRADLFLIIPAQIAALVYAWRRRKHLRAP